MVPRAYIPACGGMGAGGSLWAMTRCAGCWTPASRPARWVTLTAVLDLGPGDLAVRAAHRDVIAHPATRALAARLPDWAAGARLSGHNSPAFAPNLLNLLADMGAAAGDFGGIEQILDVMLAHQEPTGRFPSYAPAGGSGQPVWGALLCDSHAVLEVLVRFGRAHDIHAVDRG